MEIINWLKRNFRKKIIKQPWLEYYSEKDKKIKFTNLTIYNYLKHTVGSDTELIALNYFGHKITYQELFKEIDKVSQSLQALGVKEKDVVTICTPNLPEAVIAFYATNKIGAIADMIHPLAAPQEIKKCLNETKSRILITVDFNYQKITSILAETLIYKTIIIPVNYSMPFILSCGYSLTKGLKNKVPFFLNENYLRWSDFLYLANGKKEEKEIKMTAQDTALILHSGGTTGTPKGIMISNFSFNAEAQQDAINVNQVQPGDKIVTILPIFHGFGACVCLHCPLCLKVETILVPEYNARHFARILKKDKPNVLAGVPTLWEGLLKNKYFEKIDLSSLKYVISGGDLLSLTLEEKMNKFLSQHHADITITKGYGMTESVAATSFTFKGINDPGSIGIPMVGNKFCICKPGTIEKVPFNIEGEICVNGPTLMQKYLNNKKETKNILKKHRDGKTWLHTGDLGYITEKGVIYFTQRLKRVIVSSGFNIYPSQIEQVIKSHPDVDKCCVIGMPHQYKMKVAKAYIVLKENMKVTNVIKKEIKEICEQNLAKYPIPKEYEYVKFLPTTLYGKIDYQMLEREANER
ncbi:MAG: AMP-binding protein [Bacilli bacterium]|nr:AMP-binding protein [Bacilli bacterium]